MKSIIILFLCRSYSFAWGPALHSALLLSQGGEFAFILFDLAAKQNVLNENYSKFGLMTVAISMAITPLLSILGIKLENKFDTVTHRKY